MTCWIDCNQEYYIVTSADSQFVIQALKAMLRRIGRLTRAGRTDVTGVLANVEAQRGYKTPTQGNVHNTNGRS